MLEGRIEIPAAVLVDPSGLKSTAAGENLFGSSLGLSAEIIRMEELPISRRSIFFPRAPTGSESLPPAVASRSSLLKSFDRCSSVKSVLSELQYHQLDSDIARVVPTVGVYQQRSSHTLECDALLFASCPGWLGDGTVGTGRRTSVTRGAAVMGQEE